MKNTLSNFNINIISDTQSISVSDIFSNLSNLKYVETYNLNEYDSVIDNIKFLNSLSQTLDYYFVICSVDSKLYVYKYYITL